MFKLVNIISKVAIRTVTPKICGVHKNVLMSVGDILKCICMRAYVEEILPDGSTIVLNSTNYNKDNTKNIQYVITDEKAFDNSDNENSVEVSDTIEETVESSDDIIEMPAEIEEVKKTTANVPHNNNHNRHNNNGGKKHKNKK